MSANRTQLSEVSSILGELFVDDDYRAALRAEIVNACLHSSSSCAQKIREFASGMEITLDEKELEKCVIIFVWMMLIDVVGFDGLSFGEVRKRVGFYSMILRRENY